MAADESPSPTRGRVLVLLLSLLFVGVMVCMCFMYLQLLEIKQEINDLRVSRDLQNKDAGHRGKRNQNEHSIRGDNPEKRQTTNTFIQELLTAQAHVLESHCANDSRLCMRGPKGEKGDPGVSNPDIAVPTVPPKPGDSIPANGVPTLPPTPCACLEEPKIAPIQNTVATSGENLNIICLVTGNPTPYVTWKQNGVTVSKGPVLHLTNVNPGMSGNYSCVARNLIGEQSKAMDLKVL